jgi:hypothetical protein
MKKSDLWDAIDILWSYMPSAQRTDIDKEHPGLVELCRHAANMSAPSWVKTRAREQDATQDH